MSEIIYFTQCKNSQLLQFFSRKNIYMYRKCTKFFFKDTIIQPAQDSARKGKRESEREGKREREKGETEKESEKDKES